MDISISSENLGICNWVMEGNEKNLTPVLTHDALHIENAARSPHKSVPYFTNYNVPLFRLEKKKWHRLCLYQLTEVSVKICRWVHWATNGKPMSTNEKSSEDQWRSNEEQGGLVMKTQRPNNQWLDDNAQPTANRQMDTQPNFTSEMLFGISGPQPMVKEEGGDVSD